jgi:hypothetical protein
VHERLVAGLRAHRPQPAVKLYLQRARPRVATEMGNRATGTGRAAPPSRGDPGRTDQVGYLRGRSQQSGGAGAAGAVVGWVRDVSGVIADLDGVAVRTFGVGRQFVSFALAVCG